MATSQTDQTEELTPEVIQRYKRELEADKKELQDWFETHPDKIDLTGYEATEKAKEIVKHDNERREKKEKLQDIEDTLARIEDGSFGTCPICKGKIPKPRLDLNHTYKRCCPCQANHFAEQLKPKGNNNHRPRASRKKQNPKKPSQHRT